MRQQTGPRIMAPPKLELPQSVYKRFPGLKESVDDYHAKLTEYMQEHVATEIKKVV